MDTINIYSYNILSTDLVDPKWHKKCNPEYLKTNYRFKLISQRIKLQIKNETIICLQELSDDWISLLLPIFNKNNYTFIYDSIWCSVGIAIPNRYTIESIKFITIGKELEKLCSLDSEITDSWNRAINCRNRMILLTLHQKIEKYNQFGEYFKVVNCPFIVANYHMPCKFKDPSLMIIHTSMLLKLVRENAFNILTPYIICGDFNRTPESESYKFITKGGNFKDHFETTKHVIPNLTNNEFPLRSVYFKEPLFTNFSHINNEFCDTLDYIFISNQFKVVSVLEIDYLEKPKDTTFPNENEPSDHLPIGATLSCNIANTDPVTIEFDYITFQKLDYKIGLLYQTLYIWFNQLKTSIKKNDAIFLNSYISRKTTPSFEDLLRDPLYSRISYDMVTSVIIKGDPSLASKLQDVEQQLKDKVC
jgi:exonuclease III